MVGARKRHCTGTTRKNLPCKLDALPGEERCGFHLEQAQNLLGWIEQHWKLSSFLRLEAELRDAKSKPSIIHFGRGEAFSLEEAKSPIGLEARRVDILGCTQMVEDRAHSSL